MGDRWHRKGSSRNDFFRYLGGYTGSHLPQSPAVQAVTTWTSTGRGEKSRTSVEHINTNDLGLEC